MFPFLSLQPRVKAQKRMIDQMTDHVFEAIFGPDPKDEQLLICGVYREFLKMHNTLKRTGYASKSWEHETRLGFLSFLVDTLKPYRVEGRSVSMVYTVNQLKPLFKEKFSNDYVTSYGGAEEAALLLFLSVRELAADIRECYPELDHGRLVRVARALL